MALNCLIEDCQIKLWAYVIKLFIDRVFKFDLFQCMPFRRLLMDIEKWRASQCLLEII